jgi:hypothetical protein
VSGEGPGVCKTPETRYGYEFRVNVQNGDELTASASIGGNLTQVTSARIDEHGNFVMAATKASAASEWGPITWTMSEATGQFVALADGTRRLEARLAVERQWANAWGPQHYKDECTIDIRKSAGSVH